MRRHGRRSRRPSRAAGYNLVVLIIAITVLNILVAAALPLWSTAAQRDREEELIFRGLQYAEAIRVFQRRFSRLPVRLEELIEVHPRCIRRLWKDPMTEDGQWGLLVTRIPPAVGGEGAEGRAPDQAPPQAVPVPRPPGGTRGRGGRQVIVGPIQGVYSLSEAEAIKSFLGQDRYNQWHFTADLVLAQAAPAGRDLPPRILPSRWIGRPFRHGVEPAQGTAPGGLGRQPQSGRPGQPPLPTPPGPQRRGPP